MLGFTFTQVASEHMLARGLEPFDMLGTIPEMLSEADPRPAAEQLDTGYRHGGGWKPFKGFRYSKDQMSLSYSGDPPMRAIASAKLHTETIIVFESSWVAVVQPDNSFEVSRMD